MRVSQDGQFLVTASDKGTLLRVFNTIDGSQVKELRRGADQAAIVDVNIDPSNKYLCCSSDKGTIHIFSMDDEQKNKASKLSVLGGYFSSTWGFTVFRVKDGACKTAIIGKKVFAISTSGTFYQGEIGGTEDVKIE